MPITTYSELQTAALRWLVRESDTDAIARCPDWISLAEDLLRQDMSELRLRQGEVRSQNSTFSAEYTALPSDFIMMRQIRLESDPVTSLEYMTPDQMDRQYAANMTSRPRTFCIQGNSIRVAPAPDRTYTATLTYYALPALSVSNTTNWLLTLTPRLYLYSTLIEAAMYYRDDDLRKQLLAEREMMLNKLQTTSGADEQSGPVRVRSDFVPI